MDSSDASMANGAPGGPGGVACMAVLNVQTSSVTSDIKEKMKNKGLIVMLVGYCENHSTGTYRFLNMDTRKIIFSRDVIWMNKYFGEFYKVKKEDTRNTIDMVFFDRYFTNNKEYERREVTNLEYENKVIYAGRTRSQTENG